MYKVIHGHQGILLKMVNTKEEARKALDLYAARDYDPCVFDENGNDITDEFYFDECPAEWPERRCNVARRGEWFINSDGSIMVKTLREWFALLQIHPVMINTQEGQRVQMWKSAHKYERHGLIDIASDGGCYLTHDNARDYMDRLFRTGNADFDVKLVLYK